VDIDRGQLVRRRLKDVAVVMELHELPQSVGGPWAGESENCSSGSPRWLRIFQIGPGSVMKLVLHERDQRRDHDRRRGCLAGRMSLRLHVAIHSPKK
jgi:hypothetical protein